MADGQELEDGAQSLDTFQGIGGAAPNLSTTQEVSAPSDQAEPVAPPKPKHAGGRPTKFNPAIAARFLTVFGRGCSVSVAASAAGVPKSTVLTWVARGRQARSGRLHQFATAFGNVRDAAEAEVVDVVYEAATVKRDARAAQFWLERRRRKRWGRNTAVAVTTPKLIQVDWSQFPTLEDAYRWASQGATPDENIERMRAVVAEDERMLAAARRELLANGHRAG